MTMLEDARAVLGADDRLHVRDIAEIVAGALPDPDRVAAAPAAGVVNSAP